MLEVLTGMVLARGVLILWNRAILVEAARQLPEWVKRPARAVGLTSGMRRLVGYKAFEVFGALGDKEWLATIEGSLTKSTWNGIALPGFPSAQLQIATVGAANEQTLRQAGAFYLLVRDACRDHGRLLKHNSQVLDFGIGWGRIVRYFLRDVDPNGLHGVDVSEELMGEARNTGCPAALRKVEPLGALPYPDNTFDVVYAYSVFTHLPEHTQDLWLAEIKRTLKLGGVFVATVESPRLIPQRLMIDTADERQHPRERWIARNLKSNPAIAASLEASGFAYIGSPESTYGDTMMTEGYVREHWGRYFEVLRLIDEPDAWQVPVIMRKSAP